MLFTEHQERKTTRKTHEHHDHVHGANCGHTAIEHRGYADYLHDGHLRREYNDRRDEYALSVNEANPDGCHPVDICHGHIHDEGCGHEAVPHGDHVDYIVNGRLHHRHGDHYDDHGLAGIAK